jgi:hypothetical protein
MTKHKSRTQNKKSRLAHFRIAFQEGRAKLDPLPILTNLNAPNHAYNPITTNVVGDPLIVQRPGWSDDGQRHQGRREHQENARQSIKRTRFSAIKKLYRDVFDEEEVAFATDIPYG